MGCGYSDKKAIPRKASLVKGLPEVGKMIPLGMPGYGYYKETRLLYKTRAGSNLTYRMNAERGFTLFELMVVIAVISILSIVTIPKYQKAVEHYQLESSVQKVITTLRYARQLAIKDRSAHSYYVGFTSGGMQILYGLYQYGTTPQTLAAYGSPVMFDTGVQFLPDTISSPEPTLPSLATIASQSIDQVTVNGTNYTLGVTYVATDAQYKYYSQDICYQWEGFLGTLENTSEPTIYTGLLESNISFTIQGGLGDKVTMTINAVTGDVTQSWP
jgi:prepilin-type N-terminal cleavage/methylation domain-containing protein